MELFKDGFREGGTDSWTDSLTVAPKGNVYAIEAWNYRICLVLKKVDWF
ncbi:MAG: hypothetical protein V4543_14745 [Bacteroidota bacterium]